MEVSEAEEVSEGASKEFLKYSAEVKRLEKAALQIKRTALPDENVLSDFDSEDVSIKTYEDALERARKIEGGGVKGTGKREVPEPKRMLTEEELIRIPKEKIEVVARSEKEILEEERKLKEMKEKFVKLLSELPKEEPQKPKLLEEVAKKSEEKIEESKPEEIKELSENFKKIMMKKEEREKMERIRKMKKEIEEMLESGEL